jgi:hypothetical protein
MLKERLRQALIKQAQTGSPTTYRELASRLGLQPPNTIRRVAETLETLMEDDVAAGLPILSALCVSRTRTGIPQPGFFLPKLWGSFPAIPPAPRQLLSTHAKWSVSFRSTEPCLGIKPSGVAGERVYRS